MRGGIQRRHKKRTRGLKKTLSHKDEEEEEEEEYANHSVDETNLEYEDEDESETEKVPKPQRKRKKRRQKLLEQDEDDDGDIDGVDKEEIDMSIHMLDKTKGFGSDKVADSEGDGAAGGTEEDGNVELSAEDQQSSYADMRKSTKHKNKKIKEGEEDKDDDADDENMVDRVKSKQKSKKLFGAALARKSRKKSSYSDNNQRNVTFVVTQDDDQYNVHMRTIDERVKDDGDHDDNGAENEMAKKLLKKK